jgi:Cdc6-like AAA superfamily ATPase
MKPDKFISTKYKLKESVVDAFGVKNARKEHLVWWCNREKEIKSWNSVIDKAIKSSSNYIQFIIGSYGRGKTLSLLKISDDYKDNNNLYSIFLNLKGEEKSTPGLDLILRIFRNIDFGEIAKRVDNQKLAQIINKLPNRFLEVKKVIWKIYFGSLEPDQISMFNDKNRSIKNSQRDLAINFLGGLLSPSPSQLKELGILKRMDKIDIAKEYLSGILIFLRSLDYNTFMVEIDEFEGLFSLVTKAQQSTYIALLRSLHDFPMEPVNKDETVNMIFFIGISEDGWERLQEIKIKEIAVSGPIVPLLERVEEPIVLSTFSQKQTAELIEKRLKFNRVDGRFEDQPLIPFTEDFVEYIYKLTNGEPRQILIRTSHVLDIGIEKKAPTLDKEFAKMALKERGFEN